MHRHEAFLVKHILAMTAMICLAFMIFALLAALPLRELSGLILLIVGAAVPAGLAIILVLQRLFVKSGSTLPAPAPSIVKFYCMLSVAQCISVLIAAMALHWHNIPNPLDLSRLAAMLVTLLPAAAILLFSKVTRSDEKYSLAFADVRAAFVHGTFVAVLALANYAWFFNRAYIPAELVAAGSLTHHQAASVATLTLILCALIYIIRLRVHSTVRAKKQAQAVGISLGCIAFIFYLPWTAPFFHIVPLDWVDLLYCLGAAGIYATAAYFYTHSKKHSRKAVLALHRHHGVKP